MLSIFLFTILFNFVYGYKIISYVPDWKELSDTISFEKFTHLNYAFGIPDENGKIYYKKEVLEKLSNICKNKNINLVFSIGGWSGSKYFSEITKDITKTNNFINDFKNIVNDYNHSWTFSAKMSEFENLSNSDESSDSSKLLTKQFIKTIK